MRTARIASSAALVLVLALAASAAERGEIRERADSWVEDIDQIVDVGRGGTLTLKAGAASVDVDSWDKDGVRLRIVKKAEVYTREEAERLLEASAVEVERDGDDLQVTIEEPKRGARSLSVDIDVTLPRPYSVDVKTDGGSIEVADMEGNVTVETGGGGIVIGTVRNGSVSARTGGGGIDIDSIENGDGFAKTGGGGIDVDRVTGDLVVETGGGGIAIGEVGGHFEAHTGGGGVSLESGGQAVSIETGGGGIAIEAAIGPVEAHSGGGGISIEDAQGPVAAETGGGGVSIDGSGGPVKVKTGGGGISVEDARGSIEAETGGGGISAELATDDPDVDTHIDLKSGGGSLEVRLPAGLQATIDAEVRLERPKRQYEITSDFSLTVEGDPDRDSRLTAHGTLNGGGDLIRLRTTNGDIEIRER